MAIKARLENLGDIFDAARGGSLANPVRAVEVSDAIIDTRESGLLAPRGLIAQLGLLPLNIRNAGVLMYRAVRLTVQGRDCISDVGELPDGSPVVIGQIPLGSLDWVVDLKNQRLIGNPEHGGEWMMEAYSDF